MAFGDKWPTRTTTGALTRGCPMASGPEGGSIPRPPKGCGSVPLAPQASRRGALGLWRSLVAHLTGGQGVAGSNPVSPTEKPALTSGNAESEPVRHLSPKGAIPHLFRVHSESASGSGAASHSMLPSGVASIVSPIIPTYHAAARSEWACRRRHRRAEAVIVVALRVERRDYAIEVTCLGWIDSRHQGVRKLGSRLAPLVGAVVGDVVVQHGLQKRCEARCPG
jgi:hypothetical protein